MRKLTIAGLVVLALSVGLFVGHQQHARATQAATPAVTQDTAPAPQAPAVNPEAEPCAKKCNFNSDCPYGKCKSGTCGGCDFNSDCKGWGKCKGGSCGGCDFNSDCTNFGPCSGGRCAKSPY